MIQAQDLIDKFKEALADKWGYIFGQSGALWTQSDQNLKINYMIRNYGAEWKKSADAKKDKYFNSASLGAKWIGHKVADCSGLFVWAYRQYNESIYHGSTTMYKSHCGEKGKLTSELKKSILPGVAVFTGDSENDHPHVGLYVGNGKVIEAAGVDAGVCQSNLSANKWKWYGYLNKVQYTDKPVETKPIESSESRPTLRRGDKGAFVTLAQTELLNRGYDLGKWGVDGDFGKATEAAVKAFQKDNGLTQDGVIGKNTWKKLDVASSVVLYSVTIQHLTATEADSVVAKYPGAIKEEERG